jgi:hypothetical protein
MRLLTEQARADRRLEKPVTLAGRFEAMLAAAVI